MAAEWVGQGASHSDLHHAIMGIGDEYQMGQGASEARGGESMSREEELVIKISSTANAGLEALNMTLRKWPPEFRAIIWHTVAQIATGRALDAESEHKRVDEEKI
jgi:hypothetical protein